MADQARGKEEDSEYRIVHPERQQERFADAGYIPQSEAPEIRTSRFTPPPAAPKPEEKKRRGISAGTVVALCLICGVLGGALGGLGMGWYLTRSVPEVLPQETAQTLQPEGEPMQAVPAAQLSAVPYEDMAEKTVGIFAGTEFLGCGCIFTEQGHILTAASLLPRSGALRVLFPDGTERTAALVGASGEATDVAVLKVEAQTPPVTAGSLPAPGERIFALTAENGETGVLTAGFVSTEPREFSRETGDAVQVFSFDAACAAPGGAVFNQRGEAVGLVVRRSGENTLPLAIPMEDAAAVAEGIISRGGDLGRAVLGIVGESVSRSVARYYDMVQGVYVWSVTPGSGAESAGLRSGDIITALGDSPVTGTGDLSTAERAYSAGDTGTLTLYRNGESITVDVVFDGQ